jgi:putative effector of murein hydrolase LrgA (UPF0299 family)
MLGGFAALLVCQLAGEALARLAGLPVPGPVLGLVVLILWLALPLPKPGEIAPAANGLLKNLALMFVPAGVGVVQHLDRLAAGGWRLMAVIVASTVAAMVVTAFTFAGAARVLGRAGEAARPEGEA